MRVGIVPMTQDFHAIRPVEQGESFPINSTKMDNPTTYNHNLSPVKSAGNPEGDLGTSWLPPYHTFDGRKHSNFDRYGEKSGATVVCCPYQASLREEIVRLLPPGAD
jgi:hypothetical protein